MAEGRERFRIHKMFSVQVTKNISLSETMLLEFKMERLHTLQQTKSQKSLKP